MADRWRVECPCCDGAGDHEHRPFITASPYDRTIRCEFCLGEGRVPTSWARRYRSGSDCLR